MKKVMPLVFSLALFSLAAFAKAATNHKCTLEQTTEFNTSVALATADYVETMTVFAQSATTASNILEKSAEVYNTYQERIGTAVALLSNACLLELATAEDHYAECMEPLQSALTAAQQSLASIANSYVETGDRVAYEGGMRGIVKTVLQSVPRVCWYQPLSRPSAVPESAACPQEWAAYDQCGEENKKAIVMGAGSINNLTRKYVSQCYRPACPR